jgi:hypothetical protein
MEAPDIVRGLGKRAAYRLRSCSPADGFWRELKWLAVSDPALDVVQKPFATHLIWAFWQGAAILDGT